MAALLLALYEWPTDRLEELDWSNMWYAVNYTSVQTICGYNQITSLDRFIFERYTPLFRVDVDYL